MMTLETLIMIAIGLSVFGSMIAMALFIGASPKEREAKKD